jgi:hypothetical protein
VGKEKTDLRMMPRTRQLVEKTDLSMMLTGHCPGQDRPEDDAKDKTVGKEKTDLRIMPRTRQS